jgi:hypothetical protein
LDNINHIKFEDSFNNSKIEIYDILGNSVFNLITDNKDNVIDIASYPVGMYFIKITSGVNIFSSKLIINRE